MYKALKWFPRTTVFYLILWCIVVTIGVVPQPAGATMKTVSWTTQADFEQNASTTGTPTTRVNIDTTTVPGDAIIGLSKNLLRTPSISITTLGKIYTIGTDRQSVAVMNAATKTLMGNIALPARPSAMVLNSQDNKLYVGHYNSNQVSIINCNDDSLNPTPLIAGNGAYPAVYNSDENKVYVLNMADDTVTILNENLHTSTLVSVVSGPYAAFYHRDSAGAGKVYVTNQYNNFVSVIDGNSNLVESNIKIAAPVGLIGGQEQSNVGLRVDLQDKGISKFSKINLTWNHSSLDTSKNQNIQFQIRTAQDLQSLDIAEYHGPAGPGTWYEHNVSGEEISTVVLNEHNYARAMELQVRLTSDDISSPVLHDVSLEFDSYPDIVVIDPIGPQSGVIGSNINLSAKLINQGTDTAASSDIEFFLYNAENGNKYSLGRITVPAILPSLTYLANISPTIPTVPTADYYLQVCADITNVVAEGIEGNNCTLSATPIGISSVLPDLVVKEVASTVSGGKLTYTVRIKNNGVGVANVVWTRLFLSTDTDITAFDYVIRDQMGTALAGGEEYTLTGTVNLPQWIPSGNYYFGAIADYENYISEYDETNNSLSTTTNQYIHNDLVVTYLAGTVTAGKLNYTVKVKNNGNGVANGDRTRLFLSTDTDITAFDYVITDQVVPILASGEEYTLTGTVDLPQYIPSGNYYVGAIADYENYVIESNETNNSLSTTTSQYIYNDLVVTFVAGTVTAGKLNYTVKVKNNGNGVANGDRTRLFLSTDTDITGTDYVIADQAVPILASGEEYTLTDTVDLPQYIPSGNYYVVVITDYENYVNESDELNNNLAGNEVNIP